MNIVILGAGQVGSAIATQLSTYKQNNITIIDTNQNNLDEISKYLDINTILGNASHPTILEKAGISEADLMIAVTISDESNMLACQMAHTLYNVKKKIARIRTSEYLHRPTLFTENAIPIDFIITPESIITSYLQRVIEEPGAAQIFEFEDGLIQLVETRVFANSPIANNPIIDLHKHLPTTKLRVVSINRQGNEIENLSGKIIIQNGDKIFFVTEKGSVTKVLKQFRRLDKTYKNIIIAGGGRIGFNLAKLLEKSHSIRVIEHDKKRAIKIAEQLENTLVLNGNASDEKLLINEDIANTDLFLALTNTDEINVVISILAKRLGAHKTISLIKRNIYEDLAANSKEIDMILSPDQVTSGEILAHIRKGNTMRVHSMSHNQSEAIEVIAEKTSKIVDKSIRQINLPSGANIGSIVRDGKLIMPSNKVVIHANDHILFIITDISKVNEVEKFFTE